MPSFLPMTSLRQKFGSNDVILRSFHMAIGEELHRLTAHDFCANRQRNYVIMSVILSSVADWFGVTFPVSANTGSSSMLAFLSGPIGRTMVAVGATMSASFLGKAYPQKTAALLVQIYVIKAAHMQEADILVTGVPTRPW